MSNTEIFLSKELTEANKLLVEVTFHPQVWINDYAYACDANGPVKFLVNKSDLTGLHPDSNESDNLRNHKNCPKWIEDWSGPFYFEWEF